MIETKMIMAVHLTKASNLTLPNLSRKYSSNAPLIEWSQRRVKAMRPKMGKMLASISSIEN